MSIVEEAAELIKVNDAVNGIAKINHVASQYEEYMNMTESDLDDLEKDDCIKIQYILTQYACSVSKQLRWLESKKEINSAIFDRALSKVWDSYNQYWSKEMILGAACQEYAYIEIMHNEILKLNAVINSMDGVLTRVDQMAKTIGNLGYVKGNK